MKVCLARLLAVKACLATAVRFLLLPAPLPLPLWLLVLRLLLPSPQLPPLLLLPGGMKRGRGRQKAKHAMASPSGYSVYRVLCTILPLRVDLY